MHGASFKPLCECPKKFVESLTHSAGFMSCKCAGEGVGDIPTLEIVDHVRIPKDLPAGEWVLSWCACMHAGSLAIKINTSHA
jgi:hypothetical protein